MTVGYLLQGPMKNPFSQLLVRVNLNMSANFLFFCLAVFAVLVQADEKYTTKWDHINVSEILESDRLLNNYFKCLMDKGSCTPEGRDLKRNLPDALKSECSKCSEKQKENTEKVINFLIEKKPEMWETLQQQYDPEQVFVKKNHPELVTAAPA